MFLKNSKRNKTILIIFLLLFLPVVLWNSGEIKLDELDSEYSGYIYYGFDEGKSVYGDGIIVIRDILKKSRPSINPLNILWQHLYYNLKNDYETLIWMKKKVEPSTSAQYAIYHSGHIIFLRYEYSGFNRVLVTDITPSELHEKIKEYIE